MPKRRTHLNGDAMASKAPSWKGLHGPRRITKELRHLQEQISAGAHPQISHLDIHQDRLNIWRFHLSNFDEDTAGGKQLNLDLKQLERRHGQGHILMEIAFPEDYPTQPFFLRVVRPRCCWYTGHVTAGGSICIESLVLTGTSTGWQPDFTVESILSMVLVNMIDCDVASIRTLSGPGGTTGPLRIDLEGRWHGPSNVMRDYSEAEAKAAFSRMVQNHAATGWSRLPAAGNTAGPSHEAASSNATAGPSNVRQAAGRPSAPAVQHNWAASAQASGHNNLVPTTAVACRQAAAAATAQPAAPSRSDSKRKGKAKAGLVPGPPAAPTADAPAPAAVQPSASNVITLDLTADSGDETAVQPKAAGRAAVTSGAGRRKALETEEEAEPSAALAGPSCRATRSTAPGKSAATVAAVAVPDVIILDDDDVLEVVAEARAAPRPAPCTSGRPAAAVPSGQVAGTGPSDLALLKQQLRRKERELLALQHAREKEARETQEQLCAVQEAAKQAAKAAAEEALKAAIAQAGTTAGASSSNPLYAVELPRHWEPVPAGNEGDILFVRMPWRGDPEEWHDEDAGEDGADDVDAEVLEEMVENGIKVEDAEAALRHCNHDLAQAYDFLSQTSRKGGAAYVLQRRKRSAPAEVAARAAEAAAKAARDTLRKERKKQMEAEVETVVNIWKQSTGQLKDHLIKRIERVQNRKLWSKYQIRKHEIEELRGAAGVNELQLWHGTSPANIMTICQEGFDIRVANMGGSMGAGVYFSSDATYSTAYSNKANPQLLFGAAAAASTLGTMPGAFAAMFAATSSAAAYAATAVASVTGRAGRKRKASHGRTAVKKPAQRSVLAGTHTIILSRVVLGNSAPGGCGLRRPPSGSDSVHGGPGAFVPGSRHCNYVVFDNFQAYPEYLVQYSLA
eukprot:CAMPEP_0202891176 /NCGR_PEP_ID=MMETSP1392-20130828/1308_1 /ASSEMBLY_ACC=CAM_ASM_000868 /TAXON_ID=225041 /ORGANISM="Chlamydomonas chlamydogama, Strain SAG 11-48b" /LENGTH=906 /DNA_ID=CAMNT_0049574859 /DNA_START=9 /DNA_END=2729 /DNA_ORIENTATION=+